MWRLTAFSVDWLCLQLPEHGLLPEKEVEAAVDLIAPEKPGRYVSHWRLASPAGPKFGHRVWVVIQVITAFVISDEAIFAVHALV